MGLDGKEQKHILISIIIPVYNVEKYLKRCVDSILIQDKNDIEIILVDDGATDKSGEICDVYKEEYFSIIKVIHKANEGLSSARNVGLELAKGEYVFFLDSDDCVHARFLEFNRKRMHSRKYDIIEFKCCCEYEYNVYYPALKETETEFTTKNCIENIIKAKMGNEICLRIYKRKLFENIRFPLGRNYEDIAIYFKLLLKSATILHIDSEYYIYNLTNKNSITKSISTKNLTDMYLSITELCEGIKAFCAKSQINPLYIEYYKRHSYIYIYLKLLDCKEECGLKSEIKQYLATHNKYNIIRYRHYDIKRWGYYQILHLFGKA